MKICQCDKSVIETLSSEVEILGCPEADPGCSQVPDNSTFLDEIEWAMSYNNIFLRKMD